MSYNKKYRLRKDNLIVGYAKETPNGILFKGKEWLWFMSRRIVYNKIDEFIGVKDVLNREIYELDIVKYRIDKNLKEREGIVLWETSNKQYVLLDTKSKHCTPIFLGETYLFHNDKMEVVSHLFNHPNLIEKLGLQVE